MLASSVPAVVALYHLIVPPFVVAANNVNVPPPQRAESVVEVTCGLFTTIGVPNEDAGHSNEVSAPALTTNL